MVLQRIYSSSNQSSFAKNAAEAAVYSHVFSLPSLEAEVSKAYCQLDMLEWSHFLKMELIIHASWQLISNSTTIEFIHHII